MSIKFMKKASHILPIRELNIINYVNVWQISAELINHIVPETSVWL